MTDETRQAVEQVASECLDGITVKTSKGRVYWMDDWTQCDALVNAGLLRRVHGGPGTFGHVDFYRD